MQKGLVETPHAVALDLVTGYFRRGARYHTWRPHGVADWLMICTLAGRGQIGYGTNGKVAGKIHAEAGDIVLLKPGTLHDYGSEPVVGRWEFVWTHFQPKAGWHDLLHWPAAMNGWPGLMRLRLPAARRGNIAKRFMDTHRLATGAQRRRIELAQNALEEVLLWCDSLNPSSSAMDARIQKTMDAVCADLHKPVDLNALADIAGLSTSR